MDGQAEERLASNEYGGSIVGWVVFLKRYSRSTHYSTLFCLLLS